MSKYSAGDGPTIHNISDETSLDLDTNDREFTFSWRPLFSSSRDDKKPNQKMPGKLVFNININISAVQSAESSHIRFGAEFDKVQVTVGAPQPEELAPPVESCRSTPIQVNVEGGSVAARTKKRVRFPPPTSERRGESPPTKKRVQFQGAGPSQPAAVVDRRGEPKKFLHRDQYQNSDHHDSQLTPIKSLGYGALARRGYNPISPPSPRHSGNRPLKICDHLIESIRQINEKEDAEDEDMDQEMTGSNNIVYTYSSLQREKEKGKEEAGPTDAEDDEDDTSDSTRRLLEQLSQKDEQLLRMEKKLEEMMTMISVMQANSPPTSQV